MNLVRVRTASGRAVHGAWDGDSIAILDGSIATGFRPTGASIPYRAADLLAPVEPSKVVGVATNYAAHAAEMGKPIPDEPRIFVKPSTSVIGPNDAIVVPPGTERVDPEAELGIVIGRKLSWANADEALAAVFGYTCVNDVTARDYQKKDGIFGRAKGFDTFCPIGPCVTTGLDPRDLRVTCEVDGVMRQDGRTNDMVFDVPALLAFISRVMTLLPGDVIATGTPPGVAPIVAGNRVRIGVEGVGFLENPVVNRGDRRG
jgi:2-keto-4-pentenoate hydratase/2-oxohepta-3-ene-1,7-dioic acid hydratase in catechol pathway